MTRPLTTRVDNTVIFESGYYRLLTLTERLTLWLAKRCNAIVCLHEYPRPTPWRL